MDCNHSTFLQQAKKFLAVLDVANTFVRCYSLKRDFMAGKLGYQVSIISAKAKLWRGQE